MRLGVLTAVWKRPEITAFCLGHMTNRRITGLTLVPIAAVSEDVDYGPIGWGQVHHSNEPLGAKWNAGMKLMREREVDAVLIMGSDDIINDAALEFYRDSTPDFGSLGQMYVYDSASGACVNLYRGCMGAGRFIMAPMLDKCDWAPWDPNKNRSIDKCVDASLGMSPIIAQSSLAKVMDIKTSVNMWSYEYISQRTRCEDVDGAEALAHFGLTPEMIPREGQP